MALGCFLDFGFYGKLESRPGTFQYLAEGPECSSSVSWKPSPCASRKNISDDPVPVIGMTQVTMSSWSIITDRTDRETSQAAEK